MESDLDILRTMIDFNREFIEKPHPVFSDLPICPFARKARLEEKIRYQVYPFTTKDLAAHSLLMNLIDEFRQQDQQEILLVIHPKKNAMYLEELQQFVDHLNAAIAPTFIAFSGHPADPFNIEGLHTRQAPYPHFVVQKQQVLKLASDALMKTNYYRAWTLENLNSVGLPRT